MGAFCANAVAALALLWLVDSASLWYRCPLFPRVSALISILLLQTLTSFALCGLVLGFFEFLLFNLSATIAGLYGSMRKRGADEKYILKIQSLVITCYFIPLIYYLSYRLFQGAGISRSAIAPVGSYLTGTVLTGLAYILVWVLVTEARAYSATRRRGILKPIIHMVLMGWLILFFYWADATLYVRLYGYIHYVLCLLSLASAQIFLALLWNQLSFKSMEDFVRPFQYRRAFLIAAVVIFIFVITTIKVNRNQELRYLAFEKSVTGAKVARLLSGLRVYPPPRGMMPDLVRARELWADRGYRASPYKGTARGMNVLLITVDALRPDYLGAYGASHSVTPTMDALAKEAIICDSYFCQVVPATSFSIASFFASDFVTEPFGKMSRPPVTLPPILKNSGYVTIQAHSQIYDFTMSSYINYGWEVYAPERYQKTADSRFSDEVTADCAVESIFDSWDKPFFLWADFMGPHHFDRSQIPGSGAANIGAQELEIAKDKAVYRNALAYVDGKIAKILDALVRKGIEDETIVIITADHGEAFGEHGFRFHGRTAYNEVIRIPLILRIPGICAANIQVNCGNLDLAPTILDALGLPIPSSFKGCSLLSLVHSGQPPFPDFILCRSLSVDALILDQYKLIHNRENNIMELYDIQSDSLEQENLVSREESRAMDMASLLGGLLAELDKRELIPAGKIKVGVEKARPLDEYLRDLDSPSLEARMKAVQDLGELGAREAVPFFLRLLDSDEQFPIKFEVVNSLGKIGDPAAIFHLEQALNSEEPLLRQQAILAISQIDDPRVPQILVGALHEENDMKTLKILYDSLIALNHPHSIRALIDYRVRRDAPLRSPDNLKASREVRERNESLYNMPLVAFIRGGNEEIVELLLNWEKEADPITRKNIWTILLALRKEGLRADELGRVVCLDRWWLSGMACEGAKKDSPTQPRLVWRKVKEGIREAPFSDCPLIDLRAQSKGREGSILNLRTFVRPTRRQEGHILVWFSGEIRLWNNDKLVFAQQRSYLDARLVDFVPLSLAEGWNEIRVEARVDPRSRSSNIFGAALLLPSEAEGEMLEISDDAP